MSAQRVPFNALSQSGREHLVACMRGQSSPQPIAENTSTTTGDIVQWILWGACGAAAVAFAIWWTYGEGALEWWHWLLIVGGVGIIGWSGIGILRRIQMGSRLPWNPGVYLFPLHVIDANGPVLQVLPMGSMTNFEGTHNHKNGVYQNTTLNFTFPGQTVSFVVNRKDKAEQVLEMLQNAGGMAQMAAESGNMQAFAQLDPLFGERVADTWDRVQQADDIVPDTAPSARGTSGLFGNPMLLGGVLGMMAGGVVGGGYTLLNDEMEYQSAVAEDSTWGYQRYLRNFGWLHGSEVRDVRLPAAAFSEAKEAHSVTALREFRAEYPGSVHDADAIAATHALYQEALAAVHEQVDDEALDAVMTQLFAWLEAHPATPLQVHFRPPDSEALGSFDKTLDEIGKDLYGIPIAPASPSFNADRSGLRERRIAEDLERGFGQVVPNDILDLQHGERLVGEATLPDDVAALEVSYVLAPSGAMYTGEEEDRGYVGIVVDFDVAMRVPGSAPYDFDVTVRPPETFSVTSYGSYGADVPPSDSIVYDTMASNAFSRLAGALQARLLGTVYDPEADEAPSGLDTSGLPDRAELERLRALLEAARGE